MDCLLAPEAFRPGEYLMFRVAGKEFAIEAGCVRGVLPLQEMVALTEAAKYFPACAAGAASLGGHDFPVIDLRRKLRLAGPGRGRVRVIVVVELAGPDRPQMVGFVTDRVSGVIKARVNDYRRGKLRTSGRPRRVLDPKALCLNS